MFISLHIIFVQINYEKRRTRNIGLYEELAQVSLTVQIFCTQWICATFCVEATWAVYKNRKKLSQTCKCLLLVDS